MKQLKTIAETSALVKAWKQEGLSIGLVPTMGYLHEGHSSLIERARKENDRVVVSIFVNPIQFGKNEDLERYPRDLEGDRQTCKKAGADLIFHPDPEEMYPAGFSTYVDVAGLTENLCGKGRIGHFKGVCTVVTKLFLITKADRAYFGEKDAQQLAVVKHMAEDLNIDIAIIGCPTIRETDNLAKSSRNKYLNPAERIAARILYKSLLLGKQMLEAGTQDTASIKEAMCAQIETEPLAKVEYIDLVDPLTMKSLKQADQTVLIAIAVWVGNTRLIDNISVPSDWKP